MEARDSASDPDIDTSGLTPPIVHVVDDDQSVRTAVARLLRAAGYEVRVYASAGEFLMRPKADEPGCVILDVRMPGPSGLDLQEAFRKLGEPVPIVFLTGHGDIPTSVRAIKAGAVDFLTKPVQKKTLLSAVAAALDRDAKNRSERGQPVRPAKSLCVVDRPRDCRLCAGDRWEAQ